MQNEIIQSMHDQVRAIYRAFTGEDVAEGESPSESTNTITRRFAELEAIARTFSSVMERIRPVTFTPPLDVIAGDDAVVIEVAVPGVERDAIAIERTATTLVISGIRENHAGSVFHAELPRGPFYRSIPLPFALDREPRIDLERGVLRIHLFQPIDQPKSEANRTRGEEGHDEDGE